MGLGEAGYLSDQDPQELISSLPAAAPVPIRRSKLLAQAAKPSPWRAGLASLFGAGQPATREGAYAQEALQTMRQRRSAMGQADTGRTRRQAGSGSGSGSDEPTTAPTAAPTFVCKDLSKCRNRCQPLSPHFRRKSRWSIPV